MLRSWDKISLAGAVGLYVVGDLSQEGPNPVAALIQGVVLDQVDGWTLIWTLSYSGPRGQSTDMLSCLLV